MTPAFLHTIGLATQSTVTMLSLLRKAAASFSYATGQFIRMGNQ